MSTPPLPPPDVTTRRTPPAGGGPRLVRLHDGRVIAGVAAGLGWRLGVDPVLVRIALAVLTAAGGAGLVLYGLLWAAIPSAQGPLPPRQRATAQQGVALAIVVLGVLLLLRTVGIWFGDAVVWPLALMGAGSAVLWARADDDERAALTRATRPAADALPSTVLRRAAAAPTSPLRVVVGTALVALAIVGFVATVGSLVAFQELVVVLVAAVAGVVLLFGPWLWRLVDELGAERRERARQEERAEMAAHLHDSVLQTLALIQRSSDDPGRMATLARRQERELRSWLYDGNRAATPGTTETLATAIRRVGEDVEAMHDVAVEVVTVGDQPTDEDVWALVAATREAVTNAARHSGAAGVDVYAEVDEDATVVYVRDRGRGFDPASVPADRAGLRRSIRERMHRHGGSARIDSRAGEGTEVTLHLPSHTQEGPR